MAKHRVLIEVKQCNIDKGIQLDDMLCPIALAINRKRPSLDVQVFGKSIDIFDTTDEACCRKSIPLPKKAQKFIESFDDGRPVKPFSFVLRY